MFRQSRTIYMAENKTKPTDARVDDYIASRANAQQCTDCRELMVLFKKVTRHSPKAALWVGILPRPPGFPTVGLFDSRVATPAYLPPTDCRLTAVRVYRRNA